MSLLDTSPTSTSPVSTANFILMPRMGTPGFKGCSTLPPSAAFPSLPAPPPPSSPVGWTTCLPSLAMASAPQARASSASSTGSPLREEAPSREGERRPWAPSLGLRLPRKAAAGGGGRRAGGRGRRALGSRLCPRQEASVSALPSGRYRQPWRTARAVFQPEECFSPRSARRCPQPARPGPCPAPAGSAHASPRGSAAGPATLRAPTSPL